MAKANLTLFWAKLGNETWPEKYHPVICHLIDVGQVARQLWIRVLQGKVRGSITSKLAFPDDRAAGGVLGRETSQPENNVWLPVPMQ